jgi:putative ABC transport system permease protein
MPQTPRIRTGLLSEIVSMSIDTLRTNKLRSALTVLGVVIGITSIVGMTALIRGFDQSLRDSIRAIGPTTIFVARFSGVSFAEGKELSELLRRPNLSPEDARAIARSAPSIGIVDLMLGDGGPPTRERVYYKGERTKLLNILGTSDNFPDAVRIPMQTGRFFTSAELQHRRNVVVLGQTPYQALFPNTDPIGKTVRVGSDPYTVIGVLDKRPTAGAFNLGQDDFVVIPHTTYQKQFGIRVFRAHGGEHISIMISAVPRDGVDRDQALREVEQVMRIRHGLKLDEPNDFDLLTQDAVLKLWDQISQATFLALVVISSIALLVGGIGVMAIMTISVTERTREIGVRKALGARRREILWQFLLEAVFLTSTGGVLGILIGSGIGITIHYVSQFPVSLPWWSFAIGIGFSAGVGIFFGLFPAFRASRLDPIEALRYE